MAHDGSFWRKAHASGPSTRRAIIFWKGERLPAVRARESSDEDIASGSESTGDSYADYDMDCASSDDTETEIAKAQAGPSKSKQTSSMLGFVRYQPCFAHVLLFLH